MRKLKRLLAKRGIIIKSDRKLRRQLIKKGMISRATTSGWFTGSTPNVIYIVKCCGIYMSPDPIGTVLHEYRHWIQLKRKWALWCTDTPSEIDAENYAERARKRF